MKKHIYILTVFFIHFSCNTGEKNDTITIVNSKDLKLIQNKKTELTQEINVLQKELKILNQAIVDLDKNQKFLLVTAAKVETKSFKHFIEVQGSLESDKNLQLYPEISGIIKKIHVKEGQQVLKGTPLVELSNEGIIAQLDQIKLQLKLAETTFERQSFLWKQKIGSEIQFLEAETKYLSLKKSIDQIKDQVLKSKIIAPFDGIIDQIIADLGSNVSPGITPILRIVNLDKIKVKAEIPEIHLPNVKKEAKVLVSIPVISKSVNARISSIGNVINPSNRNFRIEIILDNKENDFKPNMTAKISINDYENSNALLVAQRSIIENSSNEFYVFKLMSLDKIQQKYKAIKTLVQLGRTSNNIVEVIEGIDNGDLIVEDGIRLIKDQQIVKIIVY